MFGEAGGLNSLVAKIGAIIILSFRLPQSAVPNWLGYQACIGVRYLPLVNKQDRADAMMIRVVIKALWFAMKIGYYSSILYHLNDVR
jgi:hypothetical protein